MLTHTSQYLDDCLRSVLSQTVAPTDLVVIDNGSAPEEGVAELAHSYGCGVVRIEVPVAPPTARNIGCEVLEHCDLVINLDGDDILLPSYVERYVREATQRDADVVFGAAELFGSQTGVEFTVEKIGSGADLRRGNFVPMNSLFKRSIWRVCGGFDPSVGVYDDYDFWLSCAEAGAKFAHVDEVLWMYRKHAGSRMTTPTADARRLSRQLIREKHRRYVNGVLGWRRMVRRLRKVGAIGIIRRNN